MILTERLSFMRFLGLDLNDRVLDAKTIWLFWERLTGAGAMKKLFASFEVALQDRGYKPVGGQIVDALLIAAPRALDRKKIKERAKAGQDAKMPRIFGLTILHRFQALGIDGGRPEVMLHRFAKRFA